MGRRTRTASRRTCARGSPRRATRRGRGRAGSHGTTVRSGVTPPPATERRSPEPAEGGRGARKRRLNRLRSFASPFRPTAPETRDLSGSWMTLVLVPRALWTPVRRRLRTPGAHAPALRARRCCLPQARLCRPHHVTLSGLTLVARSLAVYASQPPSRCRPRKTRSPAAVLCLTGTGLSPARSFREVSARYMASSSPRLCLTHRAGVSGRVSGRERRGWRGWCRGRRAWNAGEVVV